MNSADALRQIADYIEGLVADAKVKDARIEALEAALLNVRAAIMEADPAVLCCTLWMPNHISPAETVVDHIDAALAPDQNE